MADAFFEPSRALGAVLVAGKNTHVNFLLIALISKKKVGPVLLYDDRNRNYDLNTLQVHATLIF